MSLLKKYWWVIAIFAVGYFIPYTTSDGASAAFIPRLMGRLQNSAQLIFPWS